MNAAAGRPRPTAAVLAGGSIIVVVAAVITLSVLARRPGYAVQPIMIAVPTGAVAVLIARHQPHNPNGWLLLGIAAALLLSTVAGAYALLVYHIGRHLPFGSAGLILYQLWSPALALYLLIILLFPDGHVPGPRWRWAVWAYSLLCGAYLALLVGVVVDAIDRHRLQVDSYGGLTAIDYPAHWLALTQATILVLTLTLGLSFIARQLLTWRRSSGVRRQQLKWLMAGAVIAIVCAALSVPGYSTPSGLWAWLNGVLSIGFVALPASIGVGILRYRLYEIDRLISRTLAYTIVTGLLIAAYLALAAAAHAVVPLQSPFAVALATLAAVALFNPLRRRVQRAVDRRFNRARYDAETIIAAFATRMQDATDLEEIRLDLLAVAHQALEPAHILLWLPDSGQREPTGADRKIEPQPGRR